MIGNMVSYNNDNMCFKWFEYDC